MPDVSRISDISDMESGRKLFGLNILTAKSPPNSYQDSQSVLDVSQPMRVQTALARDAFIAAIQ
jgi:hypothetical protein